MNLWPHTTDPIMRNLLLLLSFIFLVACSKPELPQELSTPTASVEETPTSDPEPAAVTAPPTSHPEIDFQGISMIYDEHILGALESTSHNPDAIDEAGGAQLEHIRFTFAGTDLLAAPELHIYAVDRYSSFSGTASAHINLLNEILQTRPIQPGAPLPLFPMTVEAGTFYDLPTYFNFRNGAGVGFMAHINDGTTKELVYILQGITDDDLFFVTALVPLKSSAEILEEAAGPNDTLAQIASRQENLDITLRDTKQALGEAFRSLRIQPQGEFPSAAPAAYFFYPGLLLAYDPQLSGKANVELVPPTFTTANGRPIFMAGVPDAVQVSFNGLERNNRPVLLIQPLRGATRQFFSSVPAEQQQYVQVLEAKLAEDSSKIESLNGKGFERQLTFRSGMGMRKVTRRDAEDGVGQAMSHIYQFQGVTRDGRYFVKLEHPIDLAGTLEEVLLNAGSDSSAEFLQLLSHLDRMIESLTIAPDLSIESSVPVNEPGCTLEAEFLEDITIPDQMKVERGSNFTKTWLVRNTGTCSWTPAYQIRFAGGNPLSWSQPNLIEVVPADEVTEISVDIVSPETAGIYQAWWQLIDENEEPFGSFYYVLFEAPQPATDIPDHGVIEGDLSYPSSGMPAMTIYFLRTDGSQRFALETEQGWVHYANELPVGDYYVFARVTDDDGDSGGGYTSAVLCGLTCDDHTLVPVSITEGKTTHEINVFDWYAPAGTFPLP